MPTSEGLLAIVPANAILGLPSHVPAEIVGALHVTIETAATVNCQTSYAIEHRADVRRFMASAGACMHALQHIGASKRNGFAVSGNRQPGFWLR